MSISDQKPPIKNNLPAVWDLVKKDIDERDSTGVRRYGTRLQPFNGRNSLIDAYQEALDMVVYLRQKIYEDDTDFAAYNNWVNYNPYFIEFSPEDETLLWVRMMSGEVFLAWYFKKETFLNLNRWEAINPDNISQFKQIILRSPIE